MDLTEQQAEDEFYEPGQTYHVGDHWAFRCDTVTTDPDDGERAALGWRHFDGLWEPYSYRLEDWALLQYRQYRVESPDKLISSAAHLAEVAGSPKRKA